MKLPSVQYRSVESLGRHDLGAISALASAEGAKGRAIQQASGQIAKVANDYRERRENAEYNEVLATMKASISEWESKFDTKQTYTADELGDIPVDVVPRMETGTDELGITYSTRRGDIPAYEVYPHLKKNFLDGLVEEQANKISNVHLRKQFLTTSKPFIADKMMRATVAAEEAQQVYIQTVYMEGAKKAAQLQDIDTAKFYVEQMEGLSPVEQRALVEELEGISESAFYDEAIRSPDQETIMLARAALEEPSYDGTLTEAERQSTIKDLNDRMEQLDFERLSELTQKHAITYSDAQAAIDAGQYTNKQIEEGYELWKDNSSNPEGFSGIERTHLRGRLEAYNNRGLAKSNRLALAETILTGGADPWDPDHQKAIDEYVEHNKISDPRKLEQIIMDTSIMPQVIENFLNSSAVNGDSTSSQQALEMYGRLVDADAYKVREMGSEAKEIFSDAHVLSRGGVAPIKAMDIARENARLAPELKEQRKLDYKVLKPAEVNPDALKKFMKADDSRFGFEVGFFTSNIAAIDTMSAEFNNMVSVHYERTGDLARAQEMAYITIQETWAPTSTGSWVTGDEIKIGKTRPMKYSPERMMNVTSEVANERLEVFANAFDLKKDNLIVVSDSLTARDGSWAIMVIDPDTGFPDFYIDPGTAQHVRWRGNDWAEEGRTYAYEQKVKAAILLRDKKEASKQSGFLVP